MFINYFNAFFINKLQIKNGGNFKIRTLLGCSPAISYVDRRSIIHVPDYNHTSTNKKQQQKINTHSELGRFSIVTQQSISLLLRFHSNLDRLLPAETKTKTKQKLRRVRLDSSKRFDIRNCFND